LHFAEEERGEGEEGKFEAETRSLELGALNWIGKLSWDIILEMRELGIGLVTGCY
jgi:hypothetical protein